MFRRLNPEPTSTEKFMKIADPLSFEAGRWQQALLVLQMLREDSQRSEAGFVGWSFMARASRLVSNFPTSS